MERRDFLKINMLGLAALPGAGLQHRNASEGPEAPEGVLPAVSDRPAPPANPYLQLHVSDFGAVGDGKTDDTDAINAAFDAMRAAEAKVGPAFGWVQTNAALHFRPGARYRCTGSLNATDINGFNTRIFGSGATILSEAAGKAALDMLRCRFVHISDLQIIGHPQRTPAIGLMHGRTDRFVVSDMSYDHLTINGHFTHACVWLYASEVQLFQRCNLNNWEDSEEASCLIIDAKNTLAPTSDFVPDPPPNTDVSHSNNLFLHCAFRKWLQGRRGIAIRLIGTVRNAVFDNCYANAAKTAISLENTRPGTEIKEFSFRGRVESPHALDYAIRFKNDAGPMRVAGFEHIEHFFAPRIAAYGATTPANEVVLDRADIRLGKAQRPIPLVPAGTNFRILGRVQIGESPTLADFSNLAGLSGEVVTSLAEGNVVLPAKRTSVVLHDLDTSSLDLIASNVDIEGTLRPRADAAFDLGTPSLRWREVFTRDGVVATSDGRLKRDVIDEPLGLAFVNALRPVQFQWHDGERPHHGLLAEEVKTLLDRLGIDHAAYVETDGESARGLRYAELIAPLIKAVQELSAEVEALRNKA